MARVPSGTRYLLDTNVISEMTKREPDPRVEEWLKSVLVDRLFLSVLTIGEVAKGITRRPPGPQRDMLSDWLTTIEQQYEGRIISIDRSIARRWGVTFATAQTTGITLPVIDSLLAATASVHDLVLATRNAADFQRAEVRTYNPWSPPA